MSTPGLQQWQQPGQPLALCLLAVLLVLLAGCAANTATSNLTADADSAFDVSPPPNFTRGLLARRSSEPLYPLRARNLGVEGWVMLRFSVNAAGEVVGNSIETLEEQPAGYFEVSSVNAARRLTFENTRGETVEDVRYVFRFLLEESNRVRTASGAEEIQFRELLPSRYVTPNYPDTALAQELEGYVVVQFAVTEQGAVENVEITEAEPPGVFNDEAIAAALRLRFEPRIVFDEAVRVEGVTYRFDWRLPR
jgi:TonB family protein